MKKTGKTLVMILASAMAILLAGCKANVNTHTHTFGEWTDNNDATWKDGTKTRECSCCGYKETVTVAGSRTDMFCENYYDAETNKIATASSTYIYFGVFPKTVLPEGSTVTVDETDSVTMGANTYYKGSDGEYYAKVKENAYRSSYTYTDGTTAKQSSADSYRYFKVEPVKWKVLTTDYNGKALLLAEDILTANVPYYNYNSYENTRTVGSDTNIYPSNYKYSQIRAYLNGLDYYYDESSTSTVKKTDYTGNGFLQTAFTATAQLKIAETVVDNSGDSTTDATSTLPKADGSDSRYPTDYTCSPTEDKIFLLSEKEVTTTAYGFAAYNSSGEGSSRIRVTTDYAKANNAYQIPKDGCGGWWRLRSPYRVRGALFVGYWGDGNGSGNRYVDNTSGGVVPALCISLQ